MKTLFTTFLFMLLLNIALIAQDENIKIEVLNDTTTTQYDKMLKYFLIEKTEVKHLFKIDLFQIALGRLNISYETKLNNKTSLEFEGIGCIYEGTKIERTNNSLIFSDYPRIYYLNLNTDFKYFHNLSRRIARGKNTNGFSANYFSVGFSAHMFFFDNDYFRVNNDGTLGLIKSVDPSTLETYFTTDNTYHYNRQLIFGKHYPHESTGFLKIGYGLQRRIGNIGYIKSEIKMGIGTNKNFDCLYFMPEINIKAGFAFSSFKRR